MRSVDRERTGLVVAIAPYGGSMSVRLLAMGRQKRVE